jgi:hypothetical protein
MGPNALFSLYQIIKTKRIAPFTKFRRPPYFHLPGLFIGAVGRRAGALFFARHRDYFIMTINFTAIYLDLVPSPTFTVTLGFAATYRDWQKTSHRDPSLRSGQAPTAPN